MTRVYKFDVILYFPFQLALHKIISIYSCRECPVGLFDSLNDLETLGNSPDRFCESIYFNVNDYINHSEDLEPNNCCARTLQDENESEDIQIAKKSISPAENVNEN